MTKFEMFINKPAMEKAAADEASVKIIENFLDNLEELGDEDKIDVFQYIDSERPRLNIELHGDYNKDVEAALEKWRLRPCSLAERLNNDGYPMEDIRYVVDIDNEINEVKIWLKK